MAINKNGHSFEGINIEFPVMHIYTTAFLSKFFIIC